MAGVRRQQEEKTTKTSLTNNSETAALSHTTKRRRKSKNFKEGSIDKVKSVSLKGERRHKSKSSKELGTTGKPKKNKSVCQLRELPKFEMGTPKPIVFD